MSGSGKLRACARGSVSAVESSNFLSRDRQETVSRPVPHHRDTPLERVLSRGYWNDSDVHTKDNRAQVPDMPDRIIAATALSLGLPLVTRDGRIRDSGIRTIW